MSRVVITGPGGGAHNRLEINDFVRNERQFSLYIQALQSMYSDNQSFVTSFFQIGGIHGLPYVEWNSAGGQVRPETWGGYCTHGTVLFPTWHRPYVALFEQVLWERAQTIAARYTVDAAGWRQAAEALRQPYWDWARNSVPPNEVIALRQVTITNFAGQRVLVDNPLLRYQFHPIDPSFRGRFDQWQTTLRRPNTGPNPTDGVAELRSLLTAMQSNITTATWNMLTRDQTWPEFSNHTASDGGRASNSLEAIHGNIHVWVGGDGHMGDAGVASFDPIFFLHHCNIDRMLSLWAAMHPGVWVSSGNSQGGSFTLPARTPVDERTGLTPFSNGAATVWASTSVRNTAALGYTYPDFNGLDMGNPAAVRTAITARINALYGGPVFRVFAGLAAKAKSLAAEGAGEEQAQAPAAVAPAAPAATATAAAGSRATLGGEGGKGGAGDAGDAEKGGEGPPPLEPPAPFPEGVFWDWTARIHFKLYELGTSFSVWIFLGSVPESADEWLTSPNLVGAHEAFVNSTAGQCANCREQAEADVVDEGFVHLDEGIVTHSGLGSLEPDVVEPYLKKELHWRVQKTDGTEAQLESLEVIVLATPLTFPPGADIPVPGEPRRCNSITYGRPGGSRDE